MKVEGDAPDPETVAIPEVAAEKTLQVNEAVRRPIEGCAQVRAAVDVGFYVIATAHDKYAGTTGLARGESKGVELVTLRKVIEFAKASHRNGIGRHGGGLELTTGRAGCARRNRQGVNLALHLFGQDFEDQSLRCDS